MIFERSWNNVLGLGKLLLLEKLTTPIARFRYKEMHRAKQMRHRLDYSMQQYLQNKWLGERVEDSMAANSSDYSTVFMPWGAGWTSEKIQRMVREEKAWLLW